MRAHHHQQASRLLQVTLAAVEHIEHDVGHAARGQGRAELLGKPFAVAALRAVEHCHGLACLGGGGAGLRHGGNRADKKAAHPQSLRRRQLFHELPQGASDLGVERRR